jgi:two-component system response regulator AtoC
VATAASTMPGSAGAEAQPQPVPAQANGGNTNTITVQVGTSIAEAERQLILATFAHCGHNKERTAAALGISLKTLYNRLKEFANDAREGEPNTRAR